MIGHRHPHSSCSRPGRLQSLRTAYHELGSAGNFALAHITRDGLERLPPGVGFLCVGEVNFIGQRPIILSFARKRSHAVIGFSAVASGRQGTWRSIAWSHVRWTWRIVDRRLSENLRFRNLL